MSADHLPECHRNGVADVDDEDEDALLRSIYPICICDRLRACDARVRADERRQARQRVAQVSGTLDPDGVRYRERVIAAAGGDA